MEEALERSKRENPPSIPETEILEYLAYALYKQGNLKRLNYNSKTLPKRRNFLFIRALLFTDRLIDICNNFFNELTFNSKHRFRSTTSTCKGKHKVVRRSAYW